MGSLTYSTRNKIIRSMIFLDRWIRKQKLERAKELTSLSIFLIWYELFETVINTRLVPHPM